MPFQFKLRARVAGTILWTCPNCGSVNRSPSVGPGRYKVRCYGHDCRRRFVVGLRFMVPGRGETNRWPDDMIVPDGGKEALPEATLSDKTWQSGDDVHEVVEPDEHNPGPA